MQLLGVVLHALLVASLDLLEDVLDLPRPPDLVASQAHHALVAHHPVDSEKTAQLGVNNHAH